MTNKQIDEIDDGELDEQKCLQQIGILLGPTKKWRIKRIDELNYDELDELHCTNMSNYLPSFDNSIVFVVK